jgi:acetate kinase
MNVLIVNLGSSSLKWRVYQVGGEGTAAAQVIAGGVESWSSSHDIHEQVVQLLAKAPAIHMVGHRLVHGGLSGSQTRQLTPESLAQLDEAAMFAPLHMIPALALVRALFAIDPHLVQAAVFDTAFHQTLSKAASAYAVPEKWREEWGLRRFGFHGINVEYVVSRCHALFGRIPRRMIVCHLGSGSSITAVLDGISIDTTMGCTPLDGVTMSTRCGALDPGILLYLIRTRQMSVDELEEALYHRSGLAGLSGGSGDLREVLLAAQSGDVPASLAYAQLLLSYQRAIGSMAAVLGGIDALVFSGGIGEHNQRVRTDLASRLQFLGLRLDEDANRRERSQVRDDCLSLPTSSVLIGVMSADEEVMILRKIVDWCTS